MKVLMLTDYFYPHVGGGVEKAVYEISKRLVSKGCDVLVITLGDTNSCETYFVDKIKVFKLPAIDLTKIFGLQLSFTLNIRKALSVVKDFSPDVIHAHNLFFTTSLLGLFLKKICNQRLVLTAHLGDTQNLALAGRWKALGITLYERLLGRMLLSSSDKVTAVSKAVKEHLLSLNISSDKITVIPNGVDLEEFKPTKNVMSNKNVDVIFVGRLLPNKGLEYLIDAAKIVMRKKTTEIRFKIVGDGPHKSYFKECIAKSGLDQCFDFLGKVPSVSDVLQCGGIFVRPSLTEGMPLAVLEAMACQLPVIATNVAGTPEIISHNETGFLVEPGNVEQLAEAILHLAGSPELACKLGRNARSSIENCYNKQYSWDEVASKMFLIYESLGRV